MLLERSGRGDRERAGALLDAALATSRELGMRALEQRIARAAAAGGRKPARALSPA